MGSYAEVSEVIEGGVFVPPDVAEMEGVDDELRKSKSTSKPCIGVRRAGAMGIDTVVNRKDTIEISSNEKGHISGGEVRGKSVFEEKGSCRGCGRGIGTDDANRVVMDAKVQP